MVNFNGISLLGQLFGFTMAFRTSRKISELLDEQRKMQNKIEELKRGQIMLLNKPGVIDTTKSSQSILTNRGQIQNAIAPFQNYVNTPLVSSSVIITPEKMQNVITQNASSVLLDVQDVNFSASYSRKDSVAFFFQENGKFKVGWQLKGVLPFLFNCKYEDLFSIPTSISSQSSQLLTINDYASLIGLKRGDTIGKARNKFQDIPFIRTGVSGKHSLFYQGHFIISFSDLSAQITSITVLKEFNNSKYQKTLGLYDKRLSVLGKSKSYILHQFGNSAEIKENLIIYNSDNYVLFFNLDKKQDVISLSLVWV